VSHTMSAWAAGPPKLNVPPTGAAASAGDWPLGSTVKVVTVTGVAPIQGQVSLRITHHRHGSEGT
jgi:hypothetical protein